MQMSGSVPQAWQDSDKGRCIKSRCLASFIHLNMLPPTRSETLSIVSRGLSANFSATSTSSEIRKLLQPLGNATLQVVEGLGPLLRPSRMSAVYAQMDLRKVVRIARRMCLVRRDALRIRLACVCVFVCVCVCVCVRA